MSSSKRLLRFGFLAVALLAAPLLAACTLTPVYSEAALGAHPDMALAFAFPNSRAEQIINQELALRLGFSDAPDAATASVRTSIDDRDLGRSKTNNPNPPTQLTITATLTITPAANSSFGPISVTREATATYTTNSQVLSNRTARADATEQAARAVAELLRIAVLAQLSR